MRLFRFWRYVSGGSFIHGVSSRCVRFSFGCMFLVISWICGGVSVRLFLLGKLGETGDMPFLSGGFSLFGRGGIFNNKHNIYIKNANTRKVNYPHLISSIWAAFPFCSFLFSALLFSPLLFSSLLSAFLLFASLRFSPLLFSTLLFSSRLVSSLLFSFLLFSSLLFPFLLLCYVMFCSVLECSFSPSFLAVEKEDAKNGSI